MMEVHILPRVRLMIGSILPAAVAAAATGVWAVSVVVMLSVVMSVPKMSVRRRRLQPQLTAMSTVMMAAALTVSEVIMMML